MSQIVLHSVSKRYGSFQAVRETSLSVERGEFFSLLGPSGCGKSTTLRMIAGFVTPSTGRIVVGGQDVTRLPPEARNIGIVFQNYAIFPHMTVAENIGYGLKLRRLPRADIARKVEAALEQVSLSGLGGRMPAQLSGGQLQRVALARVIVLEPRLLLLDEPLSALDKKLRDEMRVWLKDLQRTLGITTIYVTHDQDEALSLSDRIAVMNKGRVEQVGTPEDVYERPRTRFVADFIGNSNLLSGRVQAVEPGAVAVTFADGTRGEYARATDQPPPRPGEPVCLLVRPEKVLIGDDAERAETRFLARVTELSYHGASIRFRAALPSGTTVVGEQQNRDGTDLTVGREALVGWRSASIHPLFETERVGA